MAGKGSELRKDLNKEEYRSEHERIFGKSKLELKAEEEAKKAKASAGGKAD